MTLSQDNVSELSHFSTCGLLFQWATTIKIQPRQITLVQGRHHHQKVNFWYLSLWPPYILNMTRPIQNMLAHYRKRILKGTLWKKWLKNKHFTNKNQKTHILTYWSFLFLQLGFPITTKHIKLIFTPCFIQLAKWFWKISLKCFQVMSERVWLIVV